MSAQRKTRAPKRGSAGPRSARGAAAAARIKGSAAIFLPVLCLCALAAIPAQAQERSTSAGDWRLTVTPYLWAAAMDGSARIGTGPTVDLSASFGDILEDLDVALMAAGEARRDRFSLFADVVYVSLSDANDVPGPLFSSAKVESESFFATLGGGWAVVETEMATVDLLVAGRYWSQETTIELRPGALPGRRLDAGEDWFDPMVGGGARYAWPNGLFVSARALVGGFGIGADLVFDGVATVGYAVNDTLSASLGFRWLTVDYDNDGFLYDVDQYGPIAGLRIAF